MCTDRMADTRRGTISMNTISGLITAVDNNDRTHDTVIGIVVYQSPSPRNPSHISTHPASYLATDNTRIAQSRQHNGHAQPRGRRSRSTGKHLRGSALSDRIVIDGFHTLSYVYIYLSIPLFDLALAAIPSKPNVRRRASLLPARPTPFYFNFYIQSLLIVLVP